MTQSIIEWHECTQPERPERGELVLTADADGDIGIMFWRDDANGWDDPNYGWVSNVIAWAHLPKYDRVMASVERSSVVNAEIWREMAGV